MSGAAVLLQKLQNLKKLDPKKGANVQSSVSGESFMGIIVAIIEGKATDRKNKDGKTIYKPSTLLVQNITQGDVEVTFQANKAQQQLLEKNKEPNEIEKTLNNTVDNYSLDDIEKSELQRLQTIANDKYVLKQLKKYTLNCFGLKGDKFQKGTVVVVRGVTFSSYSDASKGVYDRRTLNAKNITKAKNQNIANIYNSFAVQNKYIVPEDITIPEHMSESEAKYATTKTVFFEMNQNLTVDMLSRDSFMIGQFPKFKRGKYLVYEKDDEKYVGIYGDEKEGKSTMITLIQKNVGQDPETNCIISKIWSNCVYRFGIRDADNWDAVGTNIMNSFVGYYLGAVNLPVTANSSLTDGKEQQYENLIAADGEIFPDLTATIQNCGLELSLKYACKFIQSFNVDENGIPTNSRISSKHWEFLPAKTDFESRCINLSNTDGDVAALLDQAIGGNVKFYVVSNHQFNEKDFAKLKTEDDKTKYNAIIGQHDSYDARYDDESQVFMLYAIHNTQPIYKYISQNNGPPKPYKPKKVETMVMDSPEKAAKKKEKKRNRAVEQTEHVEKPSQKVKKEPEAEEAPEKSLKKKKKEKKTDEKTKKKKKKKVPKKPPTPPPVEESSDEESEQSEQDSSDEEME